jgi:hypothetical protein
MTNFARMPVIRLLVLGMLVFAGTSRAQDKPPIAEELAKAYGLDSFSQIDQVRYTFNIDLPGFKLARSWVWEPKTGKVSYDGKDKTGKPIKVSYLRSQLNSQDAVVKEEVDPAFNNDQYWLMFPFHVYQDAGAKVEEKVPLGRWWLVIRPRSVATRPEIPGRCSSAPINALRNLSITVADL